MRIGEPAFSSMNTLKTPKDWQNTREKTVLRSDGGANHGDLGTATAIPTSLPSIAEACLYYAFAHGTNTTRKGGKGRGESPSHDRGVGPGDL